MEEDYNLFYFLLSKLKDNDYDELRKILNDMLQQGYNTRYAFSAIDKNENWEKCIEKTITALQI